MDIVHGSCEMNIVKLLVLGDASVGKTSLLLRYMTSNYISDVKETIGVEYKSKVINVKGEDILLQVWDTAGQERYKTIARSYYRKASGVIIAFDITNKTSLDNVITWTQNILSEVDQRTCLVIAATKCDLNNNEVYLKQAKQIANSLGLKLFQTSAKINKEVDQLFDYIINNAIEKQLISCNVKGSINLESRMPKKVKKKCC
jgi:Ras-related protein Rab-8A